MAKKKLEYIGDVKVGRKGILLVDANCEEEGITLPTGWGDGEYPVQVKRGPENRVAQIIITCI